MSAVQSLESQYIVMNSGSRNTAETIRRCLVTSENLGAYVHICHILHDEWRKVGFLGCACVCVEFRFHLIACGCACACVKNQALL